MTGEVGILNVGAGDTKLSFNSDDPAETIRAGRIVKDMLQRGYALLVRTEDGKYQRALDFDESVNEYIIADRGTDDTPPGEEADGTPQETKVTKTSQRRKKTGRRRVKAADTHGISVSRTAGG